MSLFRFFILIFLSIPFFIRAQENHSFLLLRSDTIFQLNYQSNGDLEFSFRFKASFLDSIGALAYNSENGYYYGFRFDSGEVIRFDEFGKLENLGKPINAEDISPKNINSALILHGKIYALSYSENSIFSVDINEKPLKFKRLTESLGNPVPNSLTYDPLRHKLFTLDQYGIPISIDPISGKIEKDAKSGSFTNFPRKKIISYGKLWFGTDGRCFLLLGPEGLFYELDINNKTAYLIYEMGFNSPKDLITERHLSAAHFLHHEILNMHIRPSKHFRSNLELEWFERNDKTEVNYYYTERYNPDMQIWEEIAFVPGYASNNQSNRYTTLDRNPLKGENCYRLRVAFKGGYFRYSQSVCYDNSITKKQKVWLSHSIVDYNSNETVLHLVGLKDKKLKILVQHLVNNKHRLYTELNPKTDDYGYVLEFPAGGGWYEISVIDGANLYRTRIFKL